RIFKPRSGFLSFLVRTATVQIIRNHIFLAQTHGFIARSVHGGGLGRTKPTKSPDILGCRRNQVLCSLVVVLFFLLGGPPRPHGFFPFHKPRLGKNRPTSHSIALPVWYSRLVILMMPYYTSASRHTAHFLAQKRTGSSPLANSDSHNCSAR